MGNSGGLMTSEFCKGCHGCVEPCERKKEVELIRAELIALDANYQKYLQEMQLINSKIKKLVRKLEAYE